MTSFNAGDKFDVIPEAVTLSGTFRAFSSTNFYQLLKRIREVRYIVTDILQKLLVLVIRQKVSAQS